MAVSIRHSLFCIVDNNGVPIAGAKFNIYAATTTTPLTVYSDSSLSTTADNPIVTDSAGVLPLRYIATASYKIAATTSDGTPLTRYSGDNIDPGVAVGSGALPVANGGTGATSAGAARTNLGAAADSTVTNIASDVTTLQGYHTGTSAMPAATGTTAQRPGSPSNYNLRGNSTLGTPEMYLNGAWQKVSLAVPTISHRGLVITNNSGTPNTQVDIDADALVLWDTNGVAVQVSSVDLTVDCTTTGANGLDAGSLANSTWYYAWVIFNPTTGTTAGLVSASSTAPTMPSGYTFKGRFGARITNGSAVFHRILQKGRRAQYVVSGATTTALPNIGNGTAGTYSSATSVVYAALSVTGVVPPTATNIDVVVMSQYNNGAASNIMVAPNTSYGAPNSTNPPLIRQQSTSEVGNASMMLESTSIAWVSNGAGGGVSCRGWEDNI